MTLLRTLRAFMWLRWRMLVNTIRGGERRDVLERVSRTLAVMAPIIATALSIGSVIGASILGFVGGRAAATGLVAPATVLFVVRIVLGVVLGLLVVMTTLAPMQTMMASYSRLLLLPIPRSTLHLVEVLANLTDPWIAILVPAFTTFAIGLAAGGRVGMAIVAAVAGAGMVFVLVSLGALVSFLLGWLLRSRRRGEMFTLVFVLALSAMSILPAIISSKLDDSRRGEPKSARRHGVSVEQFNATLPAWTRALPSELYGGAVGAAGQRRHGAAWASVAILLLEGAILFAASSAVHARLIGSLENEQERHRHASSLIGAWTLPVLGPAASAVAIASLRAAVRSVRGRLSILLPGPLVLALAVLFRRMPEAPPGFATIVSHGELVFGASAVLALNALQPFTMNLFGTDRAGLTLMFLSPVSDLDLARGKVAGCGLLYAGSLVLCLAASIVISPSGGLLAWLSVGVAIAAIYTWLSPFAVWLSALFPVAADLSKTGNRGNAHPVAVFAGLFLIVGATVTTTVLFLSVEFWLRQPWLTPVVMLVWLGVALLISWPLLGLASRAIGPRRENLALLSK
ncbi:MAG TPA: hypothetical protein VLT86_11385 [Vicinamibacterales bacterium]|nr:hypothetical protein [Vicinamibacterales bacterium]